MPTAADPNAQRETMRIPAWLGVSLFLAITAFFLFEEHRPHVLGAVPYVLLLLCPIIHLFMHRGHHDGRGAHSTHGGHPSDRRAGGDES